MRPPKYNPHADHIKEYIHDLGLTGLTQEIRFVLNEMQGEECKAALIELEKFQDALAKIQSDRIANSNGGEVLPIGKV